MSQVQVGKGFWALTRAVRSRCSLGSGKLYLPLDGLWGGVGILIVRTAIEVDGREGCLVVVA
jgi:hypothetical protein